MKSPRTLFRALRGPLIVAALAAAIILPGSALASASPTPTSSAPHVKPTIVLVHGAWADSSSWNDVIPLLQHKGYTVLAPPNPLRGLTTDSAYLASYLKTISGPVVLVGHSYGGAVITNAATGDPNAKALVYIDAFAPKQGEDLQQLAFAQPGSCVEGGGDTSNVFTTAVDPGLPAGDPDLYLKVPAGPDYPGFNACFANGVAPKQAALLSTVQRPFAAGGFADISGPEAWASIPSWALIGTNDHVIPPAELTFMAERAGSTIQYVKAGHLSLITKPHAAADLITQAARATS